MLQEMSFLTGFPTVLSLVLSLSLTRTEVFGLRCVASSLVRTKLPARSTQRTNI